MKASNRLVGVLFLVFLSSCMEFTSPDNKGVAAKEQKEDSLSMFFVEFLSSFQKEDGLAKYIHPDLGAYVLFSNGALPEIAHIKTAEELFAKKEFSFTVPSLPSQLEIKKQAFPKVNCDLPGFYEKEGYFARDSNLFKATGVLPHLSLKKNDRKNIHQLLSLQGMTILSTYDYTYYFSKADEQWFLSFIDIRARCEA